MPLPVIGIPASAASTGWSVPCSSRNLVQPRRDRKDTPMPALSMQRSIMERNTVVIDGQSLELWAPTVADFSCKPDDLRGYMASGRWDLVFNALYYLADAVPEGQA
jgi:hypothetical protein